MSAADLGTQAFAHLSYVGIARTRLACPLARTHLASLWCWRGDGGDLSTNRTVRLQWPLLSPGKGSLSSRCRRGACDIRVVACVLTVPSFLSLLCSIIDRARLDVMVWRLSCVLPCKLSCLQIVAARICTHRREGCSLRHCESSFSLRRNFLLIASHTEL